MQVQYTARPPSPPTHTLEKSKRVFPEVATAFGSKLFLAYYVLIARQNEMNAKEIRKTLFIAAYSRKYQKLFTTVLCCPFRGKSE